MISKFVKLFWRKFYLLLVVLLIMIICCYKFYINLWHKELNININGYILEISPKQNFKAVLTKLNQDLVLSEINKNILYFLAKICKYDRKIQAGEYLITPHTTVMKLMDQLITGKVLLHKFTIVEGLRFDQILGSLQAYPTIQKTLINYNCEDVLAAINRTAIKSCEGLLLADTYLFANNTKDIEILQEAYDAMQNKLNSLWNNSNINQISKSLKSSYEALILASIIEKETALNIEMPKVSGVYHRRLQLGMLLQADPTIIYGLKIFDRPLKIADLKSKSNYNTYLNKGLPPTPITTPSVAAIFAALNPDYEDNSLYFVADGYGGHVFSESLSEHNKAVVAFRSNKNKK